MKTAQTVTTAGLLKPDSASVGVTNPVKAKLLMTSNATRSIRNRSVTKRIMVETRIASTMAI